MNKQFVGMEEILGDPGLARKRISCNKTTHILLAAPNVGSALLDHIERPGEAPHEGSGG
jgi:hypothetical protein